MGLGKRIQLGVILILGAYLLYAGFHLKPQHDAFIRATADASDASADAATEGHGQ